MIELGILIIVLAAVGVACGVVSIVIAFRDEEYLYTDYHKDEPKGD